MLWTYGMWWKKCYVHRTVPNHQRTSPQQETVCVIPKGIAHITETEGKQRCWSIVAYGLRYYKLTRFSRWVSVVHLSRQWSSDQDGRCSTLRHVSRTHTIALDKLFDRLNLDPKIQIKYVDTKNQLADLLIKGNFTRDEWNHLLRLFVKHHDFSSVFLQQSLQSSFWSDQGTVRHVRESSGKQPERGIARSITKWTKACDKRLNRLILYIHHTCEYKQNFHAGNTAKQCRLGLFQDSDFAGDLEDSKSTSAETLCIFGSHTFVPISWMCKKQTAVSYSSTESEIISLDTGLRLDGLPGLELWD